MKDKKGYVQDMLFFGIILLIIGMIFLAGGRLSNSINNMYQDSDASIASKNLMNNNNNRYSVIFDYMYIMIFTIFALAIFVTVFLLDTHPTLFFVILIVFAFILIVIGILGNVYDKYSSHDSMTTQASQMGILTAIQDHWIILLCVIGFITITLLFAKNR